MKFTSLTLLLSQFALTGAKHLIPSSHRDRELDNNSFECTLLIKVVENIVGPDEHELECGLNDGRILPFSALPEWLERDFEAGKINSNEDVFRVRGAGAQIQNNQILLESDASIEVEHHAIVQTQQQSSSSVKKVLVLHVTANDATTTLSQEALAEETFGEDGTPCLRSQMKACSFDQIDFAPFVGTSNGNSITNGVFGVTVPQNVVGVDRYTVHGYVNDAATTALGSLTAQYDYVMQCLPDGVDFGGAAAYAYVNSWLSVYRHGYCEHLTVQMHEIGHNLGLAHSGEGSEQYGDTSGYMGAAYGSGHDTPIQCFNGPKSYQLGWYSGRYVDLSGGYGWAGDLYGIADYGTTSDDKKMVLRLDATSGQDIYISFNRKSGVNSETSEYGNKVMVHRKEGAPNAYGLSWIVKAVSVGETFNVPINGGSIPLRFMSAGPSNSYASIEVGDLSPTPSPTPCTGSDLIVNIKTDNYPGEITWEVKDTDNENTVVGGGGPYGSANTLHTEELCVTPSCFSFTIQDSWGDGICCYEGNGYYQVVLDGEEVASGGGFGSSETKTFCSVNPPPPPTSSAPSNAPSVAFSDAPSVVTSVVPSSAPSESNPGPSPPTPNGPWYIYLKPNVDPEVVGNNIVAVYEARDASYSVSLYQDDCATLVDGVFDVSTSKSSPAAGEMDLTVNLDIDVDKIKNSVIYSGDASGGTARFCVEAALLNGSTKVVQHMTVYTASVSMVEGLFTLNDVSLFEDNPTNVDDIVIGNEGQIDVYQCDPTTLNEIVNPPALGAGNQLTVCVENIGADTSVAVNEIVEMDLVQISDGLSFDFGVITGGEEVEPNKDLVDYWCDVASGKCVASIVLVDAFFQDGMNTSLDVEGEALLGSSAKEENENNTFLLSVSLRSCDGGGGFGLRSILEKMLHRI